MIATITLIFSLIFFAIVVQVTTGALTETRKSALIETLSGLQLDDGSFTTPEFPNEGNMGDTVEVLTVLKILNALDKVDVKRAMKYLISQQDPVSGGFGKILGYNNTFLGFDLYLTYHAVRALKLLGVLDRINRTVLVNFVLKRYNWSDGGFHELTVETFGRKYAISTFPIDFRTVELDKVAYANSNIISTFCGVSILSELGELDKINVTKTLNFIISCKTNSGVFAPRPSPSDLPFYIFPRDRNRSGVPYIFAAISALKALKHIDILTEEDKRKNLEYIRECQASHGGFFIHEEAKQWSEKWPYSPQQPTTYYTYQAIMTLYYLNMLDRTRDVILKAVRFVLNKQILGYSKPWLVPRRV